jgi:hypothetical protein
VDSAFEQEGREVVAEAKVAATAVSTLCTCIEMGRKYTFVDDILLRETPVRPLDLLQDSFSCMA